MIRQSNKVVPPELPIDVRKKEVKKLQVLSLKDVLGLIKNNCDTTEYIKFGDGHDVVVILPEAWEELKAIIGWGKKTPTNAFEQLYQGMGYCFLNGNRGRIVVVTHFLYIYAAERSPISACVSSNGIHDSMMNRLEYERKIYCQNEARYNRTPEGNLYNPFVRKYGLSNVNLYGHTHPDIGVFFSHDDRNSGYATPDYPAAIFVADPIRKQLKAIVGVEQENAQVIVCNYVSVKNEEAKNKDILFPNRKPKEELIIELGKNCNELLDPFYGTKGNYAVNATLTGKEHIKLDIKISPKLAKKRKRKSTHGIEKAKKESRYDAYA